ncbi:MAG: hypothetical protein ABF753_03155 [Lentilactobacillus hilgardii]
MVLNVPEWLSDLIFIAIGIGIGYQLCLFIKNPKAWIEEWFS